jgi:16S rRNA (cytosine967-C5)-methyltransferase
MGVLRWQSALDAEIAAASSQPIAKLDLEILIALRMAVYQLRRLDRIPARAAIHESVELAKVARKRSAASFVNAVLRKVAATGPHSRDDLPLANDPASPESIAARFAHPVWLVERWTKAYGAEAALKICNYDQSVPATAIRLRGMEAEVHLCVEGIELAPGALLASARRVEQGDITKTAVLKSGECVIQDEASQLVAMLVGRGKNILDCCAAPGGKTLAMADHNPNAEITAVELHAHRARGLRKMLDDFLASDADGARQINVIVADARNLPFDAKFDRVLADVPCSGTGTQARNPEIKWRLVPADLFDLQKRQIAILRSAMNHVAVEGRVIYSTCSLEKEENEDVVERALSEESQFRVLDCGAELRQLRQKNELVWPDTSSLTCGPYLRTIPGVHPCDGFFAAILEKFNAD